VTYRKPIVKWLGGKFRVLPSLLFQIEKEYPITNFVEPFAGSLAVSLNVKADNYIANDLNFDLIRLYRNFNEDLITHSIKYFTEDNNNEAIYYTLRKAFNNTNDEVLKSSIYLYLNRHCFNGLTRYNSKGGFNSPYGFYPNVNYPHEAAKEFSANFISKVRLFNLKFNDLDIYRTLGNSEYLLPQKNVIYFDPPYLKINKDSFTNYQSEDFGVDQHINLLCAVKILKLIPNTIVFISSSDTPEARTLYSGGEIIEIPVYRCVGSTASSRSYINELLIKF
jgi:DNA adenine methylase